MRASAAACTAACDSCRRGMVCGCAHACQHLLQRCQRLWVARQAAERPRQRVAGRLKACACSAAAGKRSRQQGARCTPSSGEPCSCMQKQAAASAVLDPASPQRASNTVEHVIPCRAAPTHTPAMAAITISARSWSSVSSLPVAGSTTFMSWPARHMRVAWQQQQRWQKVQQQWMRSATHAEHRLQPRTDDGVVPRRVRQHTHHLGRVGCIPLCTQRLRTAQTRMQGSMLPMRRGRFKPCSSTP